MDVVQTAVSTEDTRDDDDSNTCKPRHPLVLWQARDKELARTPLHFASRSGGLETTVVLLNNGADINAKTGKNRTHRTYHTLSNQRAVRSKQLDL